MEHIITVAGTDTMQDVGEETTGEPVLLRGHRGAAQVTHGRPPRPPHTKNTQASQKKNPVQGPGRPQGGIRVRGRSYSTCVDRGVTSVAVGRPAGARGGAAGSADAEGPARAAGADTSWLMAQGPGEHAGSVTDAAPHPLAGVGPALEPAREPLGVALDPIGPRGRDQPPAQRPRRAAGTTDRVEPQRDQVDCRHHDPHHPQPELTPTHVHIYILLRCSKRVNAFLCSPVKHVVFKQQYGYSSDMTSAQRLSNRLRLARSAKALDQQTLAAALSVRQQQISLWERGLATPRANTLSEIAQATDVSLEWLLNGTGFMCNKEYWPDLIKWFSLQLALHTVRRAVIVRWAQDEIERLAFLLDTETGCLSAIGLRKGYNSWPLWSRRDVDAYISILNDLEKQHLPVGHVTLTANEREVLHLADLSQLFDRATFDEEFISHERASLPSLGGPNLTAIEQLTRQLRDLAAVASQPGSFPPPVVEALLPQVEALALAARVLVEHMEHVRAAFDKGRPPPTPAPAPDIDALLEALETDQRLTSEHVTILREALHRQRESRSGPESVSIGAHHT